MKRHVIVGNGGAGISAARAIREVCGEDEIVMVSPESGRAYSPVLATHYLAGHITYDEMFFVDEGFYRRHEVRTLFGRRAVSIDPEAREVLLEHGDALEFDNLLIATGSRSMVPPIPGVQGPGIFTLWTAEDAQRIDRWAGRGGHAVIVGAGLIGMQSLGALIHRGLSATLIEKLDQVMPLVLDKGGAAVVQGALVQLGVDLRLGDGVRQIEDSGGRKVVALESGGVVEGDLVIVATGVRPNLELVQSCGLRVGRGIVVGERANTDVSGIYAAGDVAEGVDRITGQAQMNATWFNAVQQGRVAGLNMAGIGTEYLGNVRMNISFPLGIPFASVGSTNRTDEKQEEICSSADGHYRKLIFEGNRLVGAVLVGDVTEIGLLTACLKSPEPVRHLKSNLLHGNAFSSYARKFFFESLANSCSHQTTD
ncbi:MAG: FAD-dependent oxidoreductase [Chloroflexi bacterium]|nr:FAD-dependent oxidoreductase [Chloroflexota bacterium]